MCMQTRRYTQMMGHLLTFAFLCCAAFAAVGAAAADNGFLDLTQARVVAPPGLSVPEANAIAMLVDEVEKRTRIRWPVVHAWPSGESPVIAVGQAAALAALAPNAAAELAGEKRRPGREGYWLRVRADGGATVVLVAARDARGVLFGVGRLLRNLRMERDRIAVPADLNLTSSPRYPLRGHQLGYRPKTNSYDAWTLPMWQQYIRDLAVFGTNAVELVPPRTDDDADSPHFPLPQMEMMIGMSRLLDAYGLDVWVWYPAMDRDYADPKTVASALEEWGEVFRKLPRLDAVFVPGGDPGHTPPNVLMAFLAQVTATLHRSHPKARMWVSPQGFTQTWLDEFLEILRKERPSWLSGIVFGPQVRVSLPKLRALVPDHCPIRHYPDITHSRQCEYPVPDWDVAYALTEGREGINPRPRDQAQIFRRLQKSAIGFLTYSEGCNDDVNKVLWSALGWDPDADVVEVLREYSRYFLSARCADSFAQGLLALERNWQGLLAANEGVSTTLQQFQAMERASTPQERLNWRFQQALYRAYYDACVRSRLLYEQGLEARAMERLREAGKTGALSAMAEAEAILDRAVTRPVAQDWRARVFELAEALYQSIRMQLSVERYQAIAVERGANLDSIDVPLNNRVWLKQRFTQIRQLPEEAARRSAVESVLNWTNPGPGGFYDEPGNPARRPHLLPGAGFEADPGSYESPRVGFATGNTGRIAWSRHAETLYDAPLQMRYTSLEPGASYKVRIVYTGDSPERKIRLVAGENQELHPSMPKPVPTKPVEFDIPAAAIVRGELLLTWTGEPGRGGNGRGCQVSEVWLIRK
jgi:hypothetical protein